MSSGIRTDGQGQAMPGEGQVSDGRAPAHIVRIVHGVGADTNGIGMIMVWILWKPCAQAGVVESPLVRRQSVHRMAANHDGAFVAVEIIVEVSVGLHVAKVRKARFIAPLVVAQRDPVVEIFGYRPEEHLTIDGACPARDLPSGDIHRFGLVGGLAGEPPVVPVLDSEKVGPGAPAELEVIGQAIEIGIVGPGL